MNKIFSFVLSGLFVLGSLATQAQTKLPPRKPVQPRAKLVSKGPSIKDGVLMKDGKLLMTQSGITNPVTQEAALVNGTKIRPDGTVTMTNGTTATLKEGDYMSLSGRMTFAADKAREDSLMQVAKDNSKNKSKAKSKRKGR